MTKQTDTGGQAFPVATASNLHASGMTLRQYAVIHYVAAMIAHPTRYRPRVKDRDLHWHDAIHAEASDLAAALLVAEIDRLDRIEKGGDT